MATSTEAEALAHAIKAAELYMTAAKEAPHKANAARLRRKCHQLISLAESLKTRISMTGVSVGSSTGHQVSESQSPVSMHLLKQGSSLYGNHFPPWVGDDLNQDYEKVFSDNLAFWYVAKYLSSAAENGTLPKLRIAC